MTSSAHFDDAALESLTDQVRGNVLNPGDEGFDEATTLWNAATESDPAAIVRCVGPADVMQAVTFARETGTPMSVKAGGHMTTGHALVEDGLVLDVSPMNGVRVDPDAGTVRVEGGATWEQVNHEALRHGLIPPGIPESVGVGGFTTGGGMGVICREHGLAIDNLREVDVVTADGELVVANEEQNEALLWAIRGGGGNFGVVTSFEFDCAEAPRECLVANLLYPIEDMEAYLQYFRETVPETPNNLWPIVSLLTVPELPDLPEELHGNPAVNAYVMGIGEPNEIEGPMEEFADFGAPDVKAIYPADYTDLYDPFSVPMGHRHKWESVYLDNISDGLIETLQEDGLPMPTPQSVISIYALGGAMNEVATDATAYAHRDASYLAHIQAHWTEPDEDTTNQQWARELHGAVAEHGTGGEYVNNQTDDDAERVRAAYGANYERLVEVKNEWDPENLFSVNQNIEPTV
ncbi:MAG: FAD/FMN-containing dehydrogenase [Natronomonas sp.]|jgi:FAD/FMN-containing dehydrogenase